MIPSCPFSPEERAFIRGFIHGVDMRIGALERRVYKLEDVVNEILRRGAGFGALVQPSIGSPNREQLPSDSYTQRGTEQAGAGVPIPSGGGAPVT